MALDVKAHFEKTYQDYKGAVKHLGLVEAGMVWGIYNSYCKCKDPKDLAKWASDYKLIEGKARARAKL